MKLDIVAIVYATFFLFTSAQGALALAGFGNIAVDPTHYVQSVITVVRLLEQTNYPVWPLTEQSQMLISQSKNLINQQNSIADSPKLSASRIEPLIQNVEGTFYRDPLIGEVAYSNNTSGYFFGIYNGPETNDLKPFAATIYIIKKHNTYHIRIQILMFGRDGWEWLHVGANKEEFGQ